MYLIREIMYCKPGKVRPMVEKFLAMKKIGEKSGMGNMRIMTDVSGEQYWTIISEIEAESIDAFMKMEGSPEEMKEMEKIMEGYHDLIDRGRREIFRIEG
jgi:hypothetical protein